MQILFGRLAICLIKDGHGAWAYAGEGDGKSWCVLLRGFGLLLVLCGNIRKDYDVFRYGIEILG